MPARNALNVSLTAELAAYVDSCVESGQYRSASEVVRDALRALRQDGPPARDPAAQAFLLRLADRIGPMRAPRRIMAEAAFMLGAHLEADRAGYAEVAPDREHITVHEDWTAGSMPSLAGTHRLDDYGPTLLARLRQGSVVRFDDAAGQVPVQETAALAARFAAARNQASISLPLVKDGRLLAVLYVHQRTARAWTDAEEALVREVAERTWAAVERARAEAALADSEARFRCIFDSALQFIGLLTRDGAVLEANRAAAAFAGQPAAKLAGQKLWEIENWAKAPDPAAVTRLQAAVADAALGETVRYEEEVWAAGDRVATLDFSVRPIRDGDGSVALLLPEGRDITQRRQALAKLAESEERFRALVDAIPQMIWASDRQGRNIYSNARFLDFAGLPPRARDINWADLLHPDDRAASVESRRQSLVSGKPYEREHRLRRRDGVYRWVLARAVPVYDAQGEIEHWFGTSTDITEQVEARLVLAQSHEELERLVEERTRALKDAALELAAEMRRREELQSNMLQQQKLEALGQLTSGVAHDFNNVLAAISGSYTLIRRRTDSPSILDIVRHGEDAVERAGKLVSQLLTFVRREEFAPKILNLPRLLDGARNLLLHAVGPRVNCTLEIAAGIHHVLADPYQLEVALLNLAVNARDAMDGDGTVTVVARNLGAAETPEGMPPGDYVSLAVRDTGRGMPPEVLARATEAFFTTKPKGQGTGLGLAMVHGFVARSGGRLRIASEPGVGTTVEMVLPRAQIERNGWSEPDAAAPDPGLHGDATLLIVEDDEQFRRVTAEFLRELGYAVLEASNAETAMALVHTLRRLDLLLTDQVLPGSSGTALVMRLRTDWPGLPVQFLVGGATGPELIGEAVLRKPFTFRVLADAVLERLGRWTAKDSNSDRLLARLQAPALRQLYLNWHASREPGALLPRLSGIDPLRFGLGPHAFTVAVESIDPVSFRFVSVGSALNRRLGRPMDGMKLDITPEDEEMLGEIHATYRRCARNLAPVYQAARFNFGDGQPLHLERIVLPISENGDAITHLVGIALFSEPGESPNNQR